MAKRNRDDDGSRIEAAAAGVHAEERELDHHGTADPHVDAVDAVPTPATGPVDERDVVPHTVTDTSDTGVGIADHGSVGGSGVVTTHDDRVTHGTHGAAALHDTREPHGAAALQDTHEPHGAVSATAVHGAHDDDHGGGHGHAADPNAGVVQGLAPTPAWVLTAVGIAVLTIVICAIVGVLLHRAGDDGGGAGGTAESLAPATSTVTGA